jgi:hypothetical protein
LLLVVEDSVHDHLAPFFWAHCEMRQNIMKLEACGKGNCSPHGEQEAEWSPCKTQKAS